MAGELATTVKVNRIEIVKPGIAFSWDDTSQGLEIITNLSIDDINKRGKNAYFASDEAVWGWAKRVSAAAYRGVYSGRESGYGRSKRASHTGSQRGAGGD